MSVQVGELYSTLELRDDDFNEGIDQAEESSSRLTDALKVGLGGAAAGVGAAFAGMAKQGTENMAELEDATSRFRSETGATEEEAEEFSDTLQDLHKVNTDSYEELGDALTTLRQRQGDLGDETEDQAQVFLDYAKVTGQDTPEAIEQMTEVQNAWGLEVEETNEVMDDLMAISQETGADVEALQGTLAESSGVMEALGMDIEEGAAMLGHFEDQGVGAETATRGLRNAMSRIEDPTESQAESLQQLGVQVEETKSGFEVAEGGMEDLMERLSEGKLSTEEMDAAMDILGRRAGQDMVRAMEDGEAGMEEMMEVIEDSEGTVEEASEQYDKQLGERWDLIKRQYLHPFMEFLGEQVLGMLESFLDFAEEWGPKLQDVFESVSDFAGSVFGEGGEMGGTLGSLKDLFESVFGLIKTIITEFISGVEVIWEAFGDEILAVIEFAFDNIQTKIETVINVIEGILDTFTALIKGDFEEAKKSAIGIVDDLVDGITELFQNAIDFWREPLEAVIGELTNIWEKFEPVEILKTAFINMREFLTQDVPQFMLEGGGKVIEALIDGMLEAVEDIPFVGDRAAEALADRLSGESPPPVGPLSDIDEGGRNIMRAWAGGIEDGIPYAEEAGSKAAEAVKEFEEKWSDKVQRETETRLEKLEREKQEALEKAEELGASKTDIIEYYSIKRQEILDKEAEEERKRQQERLETIEQFEEKWSDKVFQETSTRIEQYEREKEEAIEQAEELGADKEDIIKYFNLKITEEQERQLEREKEIEQQKLEEAEQKQQEKLEERERIEEQWNDRLFQLTADREERLQREYEQAIEEAEEAGAETEAIHQYYDERFQEIEQERQERQSEQREQEIEEEKEKEQRKYEQRKQFEERWSQKVFEQSATRLEILEQEMEKELERADELEADKTEIIEYYEKKRAEIEQEEEEKRRERTEENLSFLEGQFADTFKSIMDGTESVTTAFENLWQGVIDTVMQQLAEMAASQVFQMVLDMGTGGMGGGLLGGIGSLFGGIFHDGGTIPGPIGAERLILAQAGEHISPLGSNSSGGGNGKQTANITIELDGKTLAKSVKQPLADEIRVKGGVRF